MRLLNNLRNELEFFNRCYVESEGDEPFSKKYETVICKLLIIREEWPYFYFEVSKRPELLKKKLDSLNDFYYSKEEIEIEKEKRKNKKEQELIKFLESTQAITKNIDDDIIRKLTSNRDISSTIPDWLLNKLKNREYDEEFIEYLDKNEQFSVLCNYLINQLKIAVQRGAIETKIPETFDHLLKINSKKSISIYDTTIENMIGDHGILAGFFTSLNEIGDLVRYTYEHKQRYLTSYLYDFVTYELNVTINRQRYFDGSFYTNLFLAFVQKYPDDSICMDIKNGFAYRFEKILGQDYYLKSETKINKDRLELLVTDELIEKLISKSRDPVTRDNLVYLSSFYTFNSSHIQKIHEEYLLLKLKRDAKNKTFLTDEDLESRLNEFEIFIEKINENLEPNNRIVISNGN